MNASIGGSTPRQPIDGPSPGAAARTLYTPRLALRPWHARDRDPWRALCRDEEVTRYIGLGGPWRREEADSTFDWAISHWGKQGFGWRSVLDRSTGQWLGATTLNLVGPGTTGVRADEVELGWWIVRARWGHGFATEASSAARDEAFERLGLDLIVARLQPANTASAGVAVKLGMRYDRSASGRHGEALAIYALDRAEWEVLRQPSEF